VSKQNIEQSTRKTTEKFNHDIAATQATKPLGSQITKQYLQYRNLPALSSDARSGGDWLYFITTHKVRETETWQRPPGKEIAGLLSSGPVASKQRGRWMNGM